MTEINHKQEAQEFFDKHGYEVLKPYMESTQCWLICFYYGWRFWDELKIIYYQWEKDHDISNNCDRNHDSGNINTNLH